MIIDLNFIHLKIRTANELLNEAHEYIKWQAPLDIQHMPRECIYKVNCEVMRVTVRLTRIIGWHMLQKAILDEEYSRKEVTAEKLQILQGESCLEKTAENDVELPCRLRELLINTRMLYTQTMRLEELSLKALPTAPEIKKKGGKSSLGASLVCLKKKTVDSV